MSKKTLKKLLTLLKKIDILNRQLEKKLSTIYEKINLKKSVDIIGKLWYINLATEKSCKYIVQICVKKNKQKNSWHN